MVIHVAGFDFGVSLPFFFEKQIFLVFDFTTDLIDEARHSLL